MNTVTLISKYKEIRKKKNITQRSLAVLSNIPQPAIARLETNSPKGVHIDTLNALLTCLGYTLEIVPIDRTESSYSTFIREGAKILDHKSLERAERRKKNNETLRKEAEKVFRGANL
ncbi:MAG: XRE family transcriptional regulator [Lachnospiraceae bacterium]|nr:XRE family transcriptional regulator [Lachnospiraceae bacterium]